jgi:hypothetical protein|tara:strand:+ start:1178 stop:1951 length:774 start_codon:yes stop_codon:yes gene_type:complete
MEYREIKRVRHYVYDHISEFYNDHPNITPIANWREGEEGEWVWSDDKRIVQLLRVNSTLKHPNDRPNYTYSKGYVRTVVGTFLRNDKTLMDTNFDNHPNRYTFSRTIKNTNKRVTEREKPTNKEKVFATTVAVGTDAVKAYMDAFQENDRDKARKKAVVLLKQRRVMEEIEKNVKDVAKALNIDHDYILRSLKHLADFSDDPNISLQSLKELGKAIGTLGGGIKRIETGVVGMFQGFSPEQLQTARRQLESKKDGSG